MILIAICQKNSPPRIQNVEESSSAEPSLYVNHRVSFMLCDDATGDGRQGRVIRNRDGQRGKDGKQEERDEEMRVFGVKERYELVKYK